MPKTCPVCGKKVTSFGGLFSEVPPREEALEQGKALDLYQDGMCASCLDSAFDELEKKNKQREKEDIIAQKDTGISNAILQKIFISPAISPSGTQDLGLITGYCIMGTGPISAIASSITDAFGAKSNAYLEKVRLAETAALNMLKAEALKKRADAVYSVRVNLTEATSGHEMLMVSASGSAVKTGKADKDIEEAWKLFSSLK
mgnify:CR=1 FL=1